MTEKGELYRKNTENSMVDFSDEKKIRVLTKFIQYWFESAATWKELYWSEAKKSEQTEEEKRDEESTWKN